MTGCCVSGCKNRQISGRKLRFYRIPSGYHPFQVNRRRLWLRVIREVNGTEEIKDKALICGAHFISGEASMEYDSPDFVPSVFTCTKQSPSPKKNLKTCRKRRRHTANVKEEKASPPRADSPVDLQSSVLMEEMEEPLTEEAESETKTIKLQTTSSPSKVSPSIKVPEGIPKLDKLIPVVFLKSVYAPASGYRCELCNQNFTNASQLVKHQQLHEAKKSIICDQCGNFFTSQADFTEHKCVIECSFPCNMCNRSFSSSHTLKRHKLLHVKDGRKCQKCGVLFCRRHDHILFLPQTESKQDYSIVKPQHLDSSLMSENLLQVKPEPDQTADLDDDTQSTATVTPLQTTTPQTVLHAPQKPRHSSKKHKALPSASHTRILSEIPVPVLIKPSSVSCPPPPVPSSSWNDYSSSFVQPPPPRHLELPPSLKMFSPQYLTSALLEVKRNYDYILSRSKDVKTQMDTVKEEQYEQPLIPPMGQSVEHDKKERTVYDLEIVL